MDNLNEKNQEKIQGGFGVAEANVCCIRCGSSNLASEDVSPNVTKYTCNDCGKSWQQWHVEVNQTP